MYTAYSNVHQEVFLPALSLSFSGSSCVRPAFPLSSVVSAKTTTHMVEISGRSEDKDRTYAISAFLLFFLLLPVLHGWTELIVFIELFNFPPLCVCVFSSALV